MLKTIILAITVLAVSACVVKPVGRGNGCGPDAHRDQHGDCKRDRN